MEMLMDEKKSHSRGSVRKWVKDLESVWGEGLFEVDALIDQCMRLCDVTPRGCLLLSP